MPAKAGQTALSGSQIKPPALPEVHDLQDVCVTENEGPSPILDRTKEHLCAGDLSVIKARRMLLDAARGLREKGTTPTGARDPSIYRVRGCSTVEADNVNWVEGVKEAVTVPAAD